MQLSPQERLMLMNQYLLLELLDHDNATYYGECAEIVREGYESLYDQLGAINLPFSREIGDEVISILSMFRDLNYFASRHSVPGLENWMLEFAGFDGNTEARHLSFARFFCKQDGGRFNELSGRDFNSHTPMLSTYREMQSHWNRERDLTLDDVSKITSCMRRIS